ncbi:AAA family ATPase [Leucobacter chromiiresistens]|uniref:ATP-binding protein n=1 Tax=Leucobacter chromiiresistens TaxID=1079994 RepID=A0A147ERI1_9MICO|nr:AAA family ATPase [Leucobacter chromiiresistens]KTR87085.1 ATP-binding protein [Leucobacter chromiiresistens]
MLTTFAVSGYRSLVDLIVPLNRLTVVSGANGTGKSNLYRAMRLLAAAGEGRIIGSIAREGGLASALWAGPKVARRTAGPVAGGGSQHPVSLRLGFSSEEFGYLTDLGLPQVDSGRSFFVQDPEVKREQVFVGPFARPASVIVDRTRTAVRVRDPEWRMLAQTLGPGQSVLLDLEDAAALPDTLRLRHRMAQWRFYDHFRTDREAPSRAPQVGTRTRWLSDDGADLAAVWATAIEADQHRDLAAAVGDAFPGSQVSIDVSGGVFRLMLSQPGLLRPLSTAELSDGTLRYLLLCAALLPSDPPPLIVVNEPEASLHENLILPLASLIATAAQRTQVIVVTHSSVLRRALEGAGSSIELISEGLGTEVAGQGPLDVPRWEWPKR